VIDEAFDGRAGRHHERGPVPELANGVIQLREVGGAERATHLPLAKEW